MYSKRGKTVGQEKKLRHPILAISSTKSKQNFSINFYYKEN